MEENTLNWYRENADTFIAGTINADMTAHYDKFLSLVPGHGYVMDLGCGAGAAALYFSRLGYKVLAVDGCAEFCEHTASYAGCETRQMLFEELDYEDAFDGIWACASLLHVPKAGLPGILTLIGRALRTGGAFYASFKYGDSEREKDGRSFSDLNETGLRSLIDGAGCFLVKEMWVTSDVRPGREDERWINVLCIKAV